MKHNLTPTGIIQTLTACNNSKGNRCSQCPMFGKYGNHHCKSNAGKQAVKLIEEQQQCIIELKSRLEKSVELPCRVGDTLYTNFSVQGDYFKKKDRPYSCKVVFIGINDGECFISAEYTNGRQWQFWFKDIGKIIFLDKKEAEQALKGDKENE